MDLVHGVITAWFGSFNMDDLKPKIYERNPDTGVIRWRYLGESPNDYSWPHYGNILTKEDVRDIEYPLKNCQEDENLVLYKNNENNK